MTVVIAVPLVSLVFIAVSVRSFGDSGACSAPCVLVAISVSCLVTVVPAVPLVSWVSAMRFFGDPSACSVSGVLGVCL